MNNKAKSLGFVGALQIVFIVLKLCNVINWSWWIVLIPLWVELILFIVVLILILKLDD